MGMNRDKDRIVDQNKDGRLDMEMYTSVYTSQSTFFLVQGRVFLTQMIEKVGNSVNTSS